MISLTQEQRDLFAAWCDQEAESKRTFAKLIEQQRDILNLGAMSEELVKKEMAALLAFTIVAKLLRSIEPR